uniref:Cytochrome P450 n=1 Tax=Otolemur garnettii TaxID=30611 RepID=H0WQM3_OTOGA
MGLLTGDVLTTLALAMTVFLLLVDLMHRRPRWAARYPPGPMPLPGLGNLLQVDFQDIPYCFSKLQRRFGDVYSLQLGWTPVVVLNGLVAVREALVKHNEDTADRPPTRILEYLGFGPHSEGIFQARYGPAWREQRRFSLSTLRLFGLGKKSLEQWVTEEASCLCAAFADHAGRPFGPTESLNKAVTNVIASLTYGRRFEYDDPRFLRLLTLMDEILPEQSGFLIQVLNFIPVLLRIPGLVHKVIPKQREFMALLDELVTEHRMTWDPAQSPRDLTDAFLAEVEKRASSPSLSWPMGDRCKMEGHLGLPLLSPTLFAWSGQGVMLVCPGRVQQEIDEVIGQVRRPEMSDQTHMPFTTAVIHEVQRFGDIAPLGVPHMTSRDIEVQGFLIPKGTLLLTNLSSVLKDETVWEKPFRFHPEHFLDAQGRFMKPEAFMPFSAGRRACLGEPLARMELFLFFTCLLQRFSFSVPPEHSPPSDHGVFAFLVSPVPYQLCAVPR